MVEVFEWDGGKAKSNLAKHRISFDDAIKVFADPEVVVVASLREVDREERFKAIGRIGDRIFTVVYTEHSGGWRIISARRARGVSCGSGASCSRTAGCLSANSRKVPAR